MSLLLYLLGTYIYALTLKNAKQRLTKNALLIGTYSVQMTKL